jgi:glycosyltransferase involved in cell wall biosynthesis
MNSPIKTNNVKRIAIDASHVPDKPLGAGKYVFELIKNLDSLQKDSSQKGTEKLEFHIITRSNDAARWVELNKNNSLRIHPVAPISKIKRLIWEQTKAKKFVAENEIDLWHSTHYTYPSKVGCEVVVTIHDLTFFTHPQFHQKFKVYFFRYMIKKSVKKANKLICVSESTKTDLMKHFPISKDKVTTIYLGVDSKINSDVKEPQETPYKNEKYFSFVGLHEPRKNIEFLIKAFKLVSLKEPDTKLILGGATGWKVSGMKKLISQLELEEKVMLPGHIPGAQLESFMNNSIAFIYPSIKEGFGLPALEAVKSGTVCITSRNTSMEEICGDTAIYINPNDVDDLSSQMISLTSPATRKKVLAELQNNISENFYPTWTECTKNHLKIYS